MSRHITLRPDLYELLRREAKFQGRTIQSQALHWLVIGKAVETSGLYAITLHGDCTGILGAYGGSQKEKLPGAVLRAGSQFSLVAGVGFEPTTFRL